jgi:CO/xanthine dehydrogenase Mo-binding subunit
MTTTAYEPNVVLATETFDVVGTRPIRHDGTDKVTGRAEYGSDGQPVSVLYCKILRSPHAHARIKSVDTSKAEALDGVKAVVTGKDFPSSPPDEEWSGTLGTFKLKDLREHRLATKKVLYKGHPVAGVAAVNQHVAQEAIELIDVQYEPLPPIMTAPQGMAKGATLLHDDLFTEEAGEKGDTPSNLASHLQYKKGDIEKGFAEADVIIEREFNTATVHQGYIEPHSCTVHWNKDGKVHIWNSTQAPFDVRDMTAGILGLSSTDVRLTPKEIGGGFGGKWEPYGEPICALLSKKTGRPVHNALTRAEELESTGPTPGSYIKVKMGITNEGKMVAAQGHLAYEAGAYPGSPVDPGAQCIFAPYDIPNVLIDGYDVVVNKPKTAAYRAPGATNAEFASETVVDEFAEKLGIDPIELRLLNAAKEGTRRADGPVFPRVGCVEVLEAMRDHPHYSAPLEGPNRGRGVAIGFWFNVGLQSAANMNVNGDGTVTLTEGSPDIGGSRVGLAMQGAEVLGIPAEDVHPSVVDTDQIGFTAGSGGSRVTFATGWAVYEAASDIKRQLIERAALIWGVDAGDIEMEKGVVQSKSDPELRFTFKELAAELDGSGGYISGRGAVDPKGEGGAFAGLIVDVEADPDTGKVQVLRATVVQDAGKAIHPSYVEGQLQGGTAQGIGWGLNEEYFMDPEGRMANSTLLDYRMPIALDLPMIDTVIVEVANPGHPFGVRGVGEVNIISPPAALANALHRALDVRMEQLPMSPGNIMEAVWKKGK